MRRTALTHSWFLLLFAMIIGAFVMARPVLAGVANVKNDDKSDLSLSAKDQKIMSLDSVEDLYQIATKVLNGVAQEKNLKLASELFEKAANQGHVLSAFQLGLIYETKDIPDFDMARKWYENAASAGYGPAQYRLALLYDEPLDQKGDIDKAIHWYRTAAINNEALAAFNLGLIYDNGQGVEKDPQLAYYYYHIGATQGFAPAQHNVGFMLTQGEGVEKNIPLAHKWLEKAAKQNYQQAVHALAVLEIEDETDEDAPFRGLRRLKASAEEGYGPSQLDVARLYRDGQMMRKDHEKAAMWYERAFKSGLVEVAFELGELAEMSQGQETTAAKWYLIAFEHQNLEGAVALGKLYLSGRGVERSYEEAGNLFRLAAEAGISEGQYRYGLWLLEGEDGKNNAVEAYGWLWQAAVTSPSYSDARDQLYAAMSEKDRAKARKKLSLLLNNSLN